MYVEWHRYWPYYISFLSTFLYSRRSLAGFVPVFHRAFLFLSLSLWLSLFWFSTRRPFHKRLETLDWGISDNWTVLLLFIARYTIRARHLHRPIRLSDSRGESGLISKISAANPNFGALFPFLFVLSVFSILYFYSHAFLKIVQILNTYGVTGKGLSLFLWFHRQKSSIVIPIDSEFLIVGTSSCQPLIQTARLYALVPWV